MNITIRFFSVSKVIAGVSERALIMQESSNLSNALEYIFAELPALKELHLSNMYAVGVDYAVGDTLLHEGDIISIIPPVQGG